MSPPNAIELDHFSPHSPAEVWRPLTDPVLHARWWAAGDVRPVVGHGFELDLGEWGKQKCEVLASNRSDCFDIVLRRVALTPY